MAWMIPENKLDPYQKEFISQDATTKSNVWIQGFAGSGKSVLLVHRAKFILTKEPGKSIALVVYTRALVDLFKAGMAEIGIDGKIVVMTPYEFANGGERYDYILCDEVQDLPRRTLEAMKARSGKVIVAGDSNQSIYEKDAKWNEPVVQPNEIESILNARPFLLKIVHRLTRSIIKSVNSLLPNMNIWGSANDPEKQDVQIRICEAKSIKSEISYVWKESQNRPKMSAGAETSAILLPSHDKISEFFDTLLVINNKPNWVKTLNRFNKPDYESLNRHFVTHKLNIQFIGNGYGSLQSAVRNHDVIVMTYHSAKGLDFDDVFLPFLNSSTAIAKTKAEVLFMVAMTRSRRNLYITHTGNRHPLVSRFANSDSCTTISIDANPTTAKGSRDLGFDF